MWLREAVTGVLTGGRSITKHPSSTELRPLVALGVAGCEDLPDELPDNDVDGRLLRLAIRTPSY